MLRAEPDQRQTVADYQHPGSQRAQANEEESFQAQGSVASLVANTERDQPAVTDDSTRLQCSAPPFRPRERLSRPTRYALMWSSLTGDALLPGAQVSVPALARFRPPPAGVPETGERNAMRVRQSGHDGGKRSDHQTLWLHGGLVADRGGNGARSW